MIYDLDILVTENKVRNAQMPYVENLTRYVHGGWSFASNVIGGFLNANLNLACSVETAWRILNDHLGRRLVIWSPLSPYASGSVWEGHIFSVKIDDGRQAVQRSIENVFNMVYTIDYTTGNAPATAEDTTSQALYGIRELAIVHSQTIWEEAPIRNSWLNFCRYPKATQQASKRGAVNTMGEAIVQIQCMGIWEALARRNYRSVGAGGWFPTSTEWVKTFSGMVPKMQFVSDDTSHIETNTTTRSMRIDTYMTFQTIISQLCAAGDATNRRWQFGCYEDGNRYFNPEPTASAYKMSRFSSTETIYDAVTGQVVPPFLVRPGRVLEVSDLMPDTATYNTYLSDPRKLVIGEVRYTHPGQIDITPQITNPGQVHMDRLIAGFRR